MIGMLSVNEYVIETFESYNKTHIEMFISASHACAHLKIYDFRYSVFEVRKIRNDFSHDFGFCHTIVAVFDLPHYNVLYHIILYLPLIDFCDINRFAKLLSISNIILKTDMLSNIKALVYFTIMMIFFVIVL